MDIQVNDHMRYRPKVKNQNCSRSKLLCLISLAILTQAPLYEAKHMLSTFYSIHRTKLHNPTCYTQILHYFYSQIFTYFLCLSVTNFLSTNHKMNINSCGVCGFAIPLAFNILSMQFNFWSRFCVNVDLVCFEIIS